MIIQQLSFAILSLVIILSFFNFKKVVLFWLPAQLLFNAQVAVKYTAPAMSLQIAVNLYLLLFYYFRYCLFKKEPELRTPFPLWGAVLFILSSYIFSSFLGTVVSLKGYTTAVKYFATDIGSVFLAFKFLKTKTDIKLFVKSSAIVFILIISLGISEFILKDNLWADFVYLGSPHEDSTEGRMFYTPPFIGEGLEMRYGMVRAISTFSIHISFGVASCVYFWMFMLIYRTRFYYIGRLRTFVMALIVLLGIFLCNSKTGMVGLVFVLLSLYPIKSLLNPRTFFASLIIIMILLMVFPEYLQNFVSLFDPDVAREGGGSTVAGRQKQFDVALRLFLLNPIFGNGVGSIGVLKNISDNDAILGAESVWMQILPERGIWGMVSYCYLYLSYYRYHSRIIPKRTLFFFLTTVFVMSTLTGDITQAYWGVVLIAIGKMFCQHNQQMLHGKYI